MSDPAYDKGMAEFYRQQYLETQQNERIRSEAVAYAEALPDEDHRAWAFDFGDWCAVRYGSRYDSDGLVTRLPNFKRSWKTYWDEPVDFDGTEDNVPVDDTTDA